MVITILEGHVAADKGTALEQSFDAAAASLPPQILHSYLVQSAADPTLWRIITHWRSREALEEYRTSVETAEGVLMFRAVGAEPSLSILDVRAYVSGLTKSN